METTVLGYSGGTNSGNLAELWLVPIEQVLAVLDPYLLAGGEPFTIPDYGVAVSADAELTRLLFPKGAATFEEGETVTNEGKSFLIGIEAIIPKNESRLLDFLHRNQERRWLAVFTDRNGVTYLSGEPEQGLVMTTARAIASANSVKLSLTGRSWHPVFMLEDNGLETLLPYSTTVYQINSSLFK